MGALGRTRTCDQRIRSPLRAVAGCCPMVRKPHTYTDFVTNRCSRLQVVAPSVASTWRQMASTDRPLKITHIHLGSQHAVSTCMHRPGGRPLAPARWTKTIQDAAYGLPRTPLPRTPRVNKRAGAAKPRCTLSQPRAEHPRPSSRGLQTSDPLPQAWVDWSSHNSVGRMLPSNQRAGRPGAVSQGRRRRTLRRAGSCGARTANHRGPA